MMAPKQQPPLPPTKVLLKASPLQEIVNAQPSILFNLQQMTTTDSLKDFPADERDKLVAIQYKYEQTMQAICDETNKRAFREQETRRAGDALIEMAQSHTHQLAQARNARLVQQEALKAKVRAAQQLLMDAQKRLAGEEQELEEQLSREADSNKKLEEAQEKHDSVKEMLDCRNQLITMEEAKQVELRRQRDGAQKQVEELEKKKQDQMARLDEIKQRVDETKEEEIATQQELEDRKAIIDKLKKDIHLLKKVQGKK
jgi:chromosome segregation ATPase